jgi:hypothetical protein
VSSRGLALTVAGCVISVASCYDADDYSSTHFRCDDSHECPFGQPCVDGFCNGISKVPVRMVREQPGIVGLAVGHGRMYFTLEGTAANQYADGSIRYCADLDQGCGTTTELFASGLGRPLALSLDASHLYWTEFTSGLVRACPRDDCSTPITISASSAGVFAIKAFAGVVYWTHIGTSQILRCGLSCPAPIEIAGSQFSPREIDVDANAVYWPVPQDPQGRVATCSIQTTCGTTPVVLATGQRAPEHVAAFGGSIYWTNLSEGSIKRCGDLVNGCGNAAITISTGTPGVLDIAVDATGTYWTDRLGGKVFRCADLVNGCGDKPTVLAAGMVGPLTIWLDDDHVYWTNDAGDLYRVAK